VILTTIFIILLLISFTVFGQNDVWNISTTIPESYTGIALSNGQIGILAPEHVFEIKHIIEKKITKQQKLH